MKRIGNSKKPTEEIIKKILLNLHNKFQGVSFCIDMAAWHNDYDFKFYGYRLYSSSRGFLTEYITWPELLKTYREIIKNA